MTVKKICCIGADIIGVTTSCVIAQKCPEIQITIIDDNIESVMQSNLDKIIQEPGVEEMMKECRNKNLFFNSSSDAPINEADIIFICVDTLTKTESELEKTNDFTFVKNAARLISSACNSPKIIVERTTLPVGAIDIIKSILKSNEDSSVKFQIITNPPFLFEGTVIQDLLQPSRILIGGDKTPEGTIAMETLAGIYENWVPNSNIFLTDTWSAELTKLATNAFLAQKISSINSLMEMCEMTSADISEVISIMGMDSRIGNLYLDPFLGFTSSIFHHDLPNLIQLSERNCLPEAATYWQKIVEMNQYQKKRLVQRIVDSFFNTLTEKKIAVFGLSRRKNTSPSEWPVYYICKALLEEGAKLFIYEPLGIKDFAKQELMNVCLLKDAETFEKTVTITDDPYEAASGAHGIVVCSDKEEFKHLDFAKMYNKMVKPAVIFDCQKFLPHQQLIDIGFNVQSVGKNLKNSFQPF